MELAIFSPQIYDALLRIIASAILLGSSSKCRRDTRSLNTRRMRCTSPKSDSETTRSISGGSSSDITAPPQERMHRGDPGTSEQTHHAFRQATARTSVNDAKPTHATHM